MNDATKLRAIHVAAADGAMTELGVIALNKADMLAVVEGAPDHLGYLTEFVDKVNAKDKLSVKSSPEPGGSRYELAVKLYKRGTPDFFKGLRNYARCYYSISLEEVGKEAASPLTQDLV